MSLRSWFGLGPKRRFENPDVSILHDEAGLLIVDNFLTEENFQNLYRWASEIDCLRDRAARKFHQSLVLDFEDVVQRAVGLLA